MTASTHLEAPDAESGAAQLLMVPCDDGWTLALHHFAPKQRSRRHPVLMVHGIAANRLHFDLDNRYSLARAARARGFDTYVLELRGSGFSRPPPHNGGRQQSWGLADYTERDVPTAISAILERTGAQRLHGVGHSMGGMILLAVGVRAQQEIASITCVGTPLLGALGQSLSPRERRFLALAARLTPAANLTPPGQRRVPLQRLLGAAGRMMPLSRRLADNLLLNGANCEPSVLARLVKEGIHDIPVQLITEITQHMAAGASPFGPYAYEAALHGIDAPVFALSGSVDRIAPPASVAAAIAQLVGPDVRYREMGKSAGDRCDYGHIDLLLGMNAPDEVYPQIIDFLIESDGPPSIA
jgi:pimeloyl-ACP methyl ester carboxylesterase